MKLYYATDLISGLSTKALDWYFGSDIKVFTNKLGLYFLGYNKENVEGPYTLEQINGMFEEYQDEAVKIEDWFNEDDEEDIFEAFYVDDDLANDIDRRTQA